MYLRLRSCKVLNRRNPKSASLSSSVTVAQTPRSQAIQLARSADAFEEDGRGEDPSSACETECWGGGKMGIGEMIVGRAEEGPGGIPIVKKVGKSTGAGGADAERGMTVAKGGEAVGQIAAAATAEDAEEIAAVVEVELPVEVIAAAERGSLGEITAAAEVESAAAEVESAAGEIKETTVRRGGQDDRAVL